jgi:hypothetical protein
MVVVVVEDLGPMKATPDGDKGRRPYAKPVVKRVHLKPEEAVLGYCKASSYSGPNGPGCAVGFSCSADGS